MSLVHSRKLWVCLKTAEFLKSSVWLRGSISKTWTGTVRKDKVNSFEMKRDLEHLSLTGSSSIWVCTLSRNSEDCLVREGCNLEGGGSPFSSSMHKSWLTSKEVVGLPCFIWKCEGDKQGLQQKETHCAVLRLGKCCWLHLPVNRAFLGKVVQLVHHYWWPLYRGWCEAPDDIPPRCQEGFGSHRDI